MAALAAAIVRHFACTMWVRHIGVRHSLTPIPKYQLNSGVCCSDVPDLNGPQYRQNLEYHESESKTVCLEQPSMVEKVACSFMYFNIFRH